MDKTKGRKMTVDQAIRQFFGCDHKEIAALPDKDKIEMAREAAKELGCELAIGPFASLYLRSMSIEV